jgi:hypothetical protein
LNVNGGSSPLRPDVASVMGIDGERYSSRTSGGAVVQPSGNFGRAITASDYGGI